MIAGQANITWAVPALAQPRESLTHALNHIRVWSESPAIVRLVDIADQDNLIVGLFQVRAQREQDFFALVESLHLSTWPQVKITE